jgi:hypothetical protein
VDDSEAMIPIETDCLNAQVKVNEQHFFLLFYISVTKGSSTMIRTVK